MPVVGLIPLTERGAAYGFWEEYQPCVTKQQLLTAHEAECDEAPTCLMPEPVN